MRLGFYLSSRQRQWSLCFRLSSRSRHERISLSSLSMDEITFVVLFNQRHNQILRYTYQIEVCNYKYDTKGLKALTSARMWRLLLIFSYILAIGISQPASPTTSSEEASTFVSSSTKNASVQSAHLLSIISRSTSLSCGPDHVPSLIFNAPNSIFYGVCRDVEFSGLELDTRFNLASYEDCANLCGAVRDCNAASYSQDTRECSLKSGVSITNSKPRIDSL